MIVPVAMTNEAIPKTIEISVDSVGVDPQRDSGRFPTGTINFDEAELPQVLDLYGEWIDRKFINSDTLSCCDKHLYLRTTTPVTKAQAIYAVATLIEWSGYKTVLIGDKEFKLVPQNSASQLKDK